MITYRWMQAADIPELSALARRIWHAHYPSIITREQIDFMLAKSYHVEALAQQLKDGQEFLLAIKDGAIIGFLSIGPLAQIGDDTLRGDHACARDYFLHKFYILPEMHGQGVGKHLLSELLARKPDIKRLRLQVARANVNSWNFYKKQGFVIECEADFDVGNGFKMYDYVMEKRVT